MRKKDIRQWVSFGDTPVISPYDSDDEMKPDGSEREEDGVNDVNSIQDWDSFLTTVEKTLRSSSTRDRRVLLEKQLSSLDMDGNTRLSSTQKCELLLLLLATYSRYHDKESRSAAQKVASQLILNSGALENEITSAENAIEWLQQEVILVCKTTKEGYHTSSSVQRANLVSWASLIFHTVAKDARQRQVDCSSLPGWNKLIGSFAQAYDAIAIDKETKPALCKNATAAVRRSIRTVSKLACNG